MQPWASLATVVSADRAEGLIQQRLYRPDDTCSVAFNSECQISRGVLKADALTQKIRIFRNSVGEEVYFLKSPKVMDIEGSVSSFFSSLLSPIRYYLNKWIAHK